jgi:glucose/arabinose dehydrogenase
MKLANIFRVSLLALAVASAANAQEQSGFTLEKVVNGIAVPWGMTWLPDGDMLVTNRAGEMYRVSDGVAGMPLQGLPAIHANGQGGLLDIQLHPDYANNGWIYFSYSSPEGRGDGSHTAIMRAKLQGTSLVEQEVIYKGEGNTNRRQHYGSRIEFDDAGYLYFSIGDRGAHFENVQDLSRDGGKIYRLHDDGRVPADNPFVGNADAKPAIYSYGHRNPQGMAKNPVTGQIWAHEHGPQGGDEVNIIQSGKNYGWPIIGYGVNYGGAPLAVATHREGVEQPVYYWDPSIAPSGMTFVTSDKYPDWQGDLLVGSLKFAYIVKLDLDGDEVTGTETLFEGIGRVRNLREGPDGYIYVATEGNGILRIVPE